MKTHLKLTDFLDRIADPRDKRGRRYPATNIWVMTILAMLTGATKAREIARFFRNRQDMWLKIFPSINRKTPSNVTFSDLFKRVDFAEIAAAFYAWARQSVAIEPGEWIAVDGKSIRSTVTAADNEKQNFVSLVSLFCRKSGRVLAADKFESKSGNERDVAVELLRMLDLHDVVFTFDAAHCQKKR